MRPLLWACLLLHFWWMMEAKKPFSSSATSLKGSSSSVAVGIREPIIPSKGCCNAVQMIHALVHFQVLHKSNFTIRHTFVLECSSFFWQMFAFEKKMVERKSSELCIGKFSWVESREGFSFHKKLRNMSFITAKNPPRKQRLYWWLVGRHSLLQKRFKSRNEKLQ